MTAANPFEQWLASGMEFARAMNPALEGVTAKGLEATLPVMPREMLDAMLGRSFNPEGLDAKTRLLLTLGGLTVLGAQAEAQVRVTVRHAVAAGATPQEVAETIALMGAFGGIPAMSKAMELAQDAMDGTRGDTDDR